MTSFNILNRRMGSIVAVFALLLAAIAPVVVSAAQVTERSIELSNSSAGSTNVTYKVNFKAVEAAGAFVVDFCTNSPVIGATCTAPASGFTAAGAASTTTDFTDVTGSTSKIVVAGSIAANAAVSVEITGINNPPAAGPLYARIVTFDTKANATAYTSTVPGANKKDEGAVALYITPTVGVSGAVQESLVFCIAKNAIKKECDLSGNTPPTLALGEPVADGVALQPGVVSSGSIFTQLTTNAVGGAIVSLKSSNACGGLKRLSVLTCDIAPAGATDVTGTTASFGVKTAAASVDALGAPTSPNGVIQASTGYSSSAYALKYTAGGASGITSTYGDPFLNTNDAPVNNKNLELTFGASITNQTPAGLYSTDLSLIATGKF